MESERKREREGWRGAIGHRGGVGCIQEGKVVTCEGEFCNESGDKSRCDAL